MTLKEFRERTKDMPENAILEFYHYALIGSYAKVREVEFIEEDGTIELS